MSMFGNSKVITIDESGLINTLRSNLESYPEDSVLREMLQNADDGGASNFSVLYSPRKSADSTENPYATAARLIVLNDGDVTDDQFIAMTQLRAASQVDDSSKIGKFGLGLKSVFHWCDIFWIFRATPTNDDSQWAVERFETVTLPGTQTINIIKPNEIESVYNEVKQQVLSAKLPFGDKPVLVFVLPLRNEATVRVLEDQGAAPLAAITNRFPGQLPNEHDQLSSYMPCLANIESIATSDNKKKLVATLEFDERAGKSNVSRATRLERHHTNQKRTFYSESKIVQRENGVIVKSAPVLIQAAEHLDVELAAIAADPKWPSVTKHKAGQHVSVPERSVQSSGIICIHTGTDVVRIKHATYLPLHNIISTLKVNQGSGFDILIHGTFHTDPGRAEVLSRTKTSESDQIRLDWNRILFSKYVSRQLLPSVFHYIRNLSKLSKVDEDRIFTGIAAYRAVATEIFGDEDINGDYQIVFRRKASGEDAFELVEASASVFQLHNLISKHKGFFERYELVLDTNVWTAYPEKGVLSRGVQSCARPLLIFGLLPALDSDDQTVLSYLTLFNGLAGSSFVKFENSTEGPIVASYHRAATGRGYRVEDNHVLSRAGLLNNIPLTTSHFTMFVPLIGSASDLFKDTNIVVSQSAQQANKIYIPSQHRTFINDVADAASAELQSDSDWTVNACHLLLDMLRTQSLESLRDSTPPVVPVQINRNGNLELWSFERCYSATEKGQLSQFASAKGIPGLWNQVRFEPVPVIYGIPQKVSDSLRIGRDPSVIEIIRQINNEESISDHAIARCNLADSLITFGRGDDPRGEASRAAFRLMGIPFPQESTPLLLPSPDDPQIVVDILVAFGFPRITESIVGAIEVLNRHSKLLEAYGLVVRSSPDLIRKKVASHDRLANIAFTEPLEVRSYLKTTLLMGNEFIRNLPVFQTNKDNFVVLETSDNLFVLPAEQEQIVREYDVEIIKFDNEFMVDADISPFHTVCDAIVGEECAKSIPARRITSRILTLWADAKAFVAERDFVKSVCEYLMPVALEGGKVWATDSSFPRILSRGLRTSAGITFFSEENHPDAARILETFDPKYRFVLLRKLDAEFLKEHSDRIDPELWFDYWQDIATDLDRSEVSELSEYAKAIPNEELIFALPIHKTNTGEYVQVGSGTNVLVESKETKWLAAFSDVITYVQATSLTESLATEPLVLFDAVQSAYENIENFANVLRSKMLQVKPLLMDESFIPYLRPIPFFGSEDNPATIDQVLAEVKELDAAQLPLCKLLGYVPDIESWVKNTPLYQQTRQPLTIHVDSVCHRLATDPEFATAGIGPLADLDYLKSVTSYLRKSTKPLFTLLGELIPVSESFVHETTKLIQTLRAVSVPGIIDLLHLVKSAPVVGNVIPKPIVAALAIIIAAPGECKDFPVISASNQWATASLTAISGSNIPEDRKLHPDVLEELSIDIPCFSSEIKYSDLAGLFGGSPVWAEYDFLVGTITALIGYTDRDRAFADDSLGATLDVANLLESAPELPTPIKFNFVVRNASVSTEFISCSGAGIEILTPESELLSLVDDIVVTENATTVYFVNPDSITDNEVVSNCLVQLIGTLYDGSAQEQLLDDITDFVGQYRSRGQSAIRQIQSEILNNVSSYIHKIGIQHVTLDLRQAVAQYTSATSDVIKFSNALVNIRSRRDTMSKEDFTAKNAEISKQLLIHTRARNDAENGLFALLEGTDQTSVNSQISTLHAYRETNNRIKLQPDSIIRSLLDLATQSMRMIDTTSEQSAGDNFGIAVDFSDEGDLTFGYEGKPINEGIEKNALYEYELLYMLEPNPPTQQTSLAKIQPNPVTISSGLDFSCVHLVSDCISIASRDLFTDVIGGFWPKIADRKTQQHLRGWKTSMGLPSSATAIKLHKVTQSSLPSEIQMLVTVCLSPVIGWMTIQKGSTRIEYEKQPTRSYGNGLALVTLKQSNSSEFIRNRHFLSVTSRTKSTEVLIPLDNNGACAEHELPKHWCGQPIRDNCFAGFAINSYFPLHPDYHPVDSSDPSCTAILNATSHEISNCIDIITSWAKDFAVMSSFLKDAEIADNITPMAFAESVIETLRSPNI